VFVSLMSSKLHRSSLPAEMKKPLAQEGTPR
jgi:hypothetical protein